MTRRGDIDAWLAAFVRAPAFLGRYPFYAAVLAQMQPVADPSVKRMAVSVDAGRFYLHINVDAFLREPQYLLGVLLHEVHHVVLGHLTHPKFRGVAHPDLMEIAMEISANEYIEEPLPGGILLRDYERMGLRPHQSTMQRYQRLVDLRQQEQLKLPAQLRFTDEHRRGPAAGAQVAVQNLIEEALRDQPEPSDPSLRLAGRHPAALIEQLSPGNAQRRPLDWRNALRMFTARHRAPRHSYARPSRRFPGRVGEIPGRVYTSREIEQPELLVALDTSASVDAATLDEIARQLAALSAHARFSIVECDALIHRVYRFTGRLDAVMGRGGTDLRPPFDPAFLRAHRAQGLVYFTDGDGPFPEQPPALPTLWVLSGKLEFACGWGQQVRM